MAKLADVTAEIRIILKLLTASLIVVTILFLFFQGGQIVKKIFFPSPPTPPEESFGKLPPIEFPAQKTSLFEYRINTLTGKLPLFKACEVYKEEIFCKMDVYKIKRKEPNLVALQNVRKLLQNLQFEIGETKLNETTYQWSNKSGDAIRYNILSDNFKISTSFLIYPPTPLKGDISKKEGAYEEAVNSLKSIGLNTEDIDEKKSESIYLKLVDGNLVNAESESNAQFIQINLFQKSIKDFPIYYPYREDSTMRFIFRSEGSNAKIADANYVHYVPDLSQKSSYQIKTADEAFEDLKKGKGLFFNDNKPSEIVDITDVGIGYYAGEENQIYLKPIIIFSGKNFIGYVDAIKDSPQKIPAETSQ